MFVRIMSGEDRRALIEKILANRSVLRERNKEQQLLQQDATAAFEQAYKPVLDPVRDTQKAVARVAQTGEQTVRALETLPRDIAAALPAGKPAAAPVNYLVTLGKPRSEAGSSALETAPQKFNEAGRTRIASLGAVPAAADMPPNWRDLLLAPSGIRPADAAREWSKWVWRESTGARQARGPLWAKFEEDVLALGGPRPTGARKAKKGHGLSLPAPSRCEVAATGIRYFKDAAELMDRLEVLAASVSAGNNSLEVVNEAAEILDRLRKDGEIDDPLFEELLRVFA